MLINNVQTAVWGRMIWTKYAEFSSHIQYKLYGDVYSIVTHICILFLALLDDLDKELNNYIMRCREWYGWHFPELSKIITDNLAYAKTVKLMGVQWNLNVLS